MALAISWEEAQQARLRRARAAPQWVRSVHALLNGNAPAGGSFRSLQGRGAMCQVRPPAQPVFAWQTRVRATALAISWNEAQHARLHHCQTHASRGAVVVVGSCATEGHRTGEASHSVQDRAVTCLLRPLTHSRLSRDKRAGAPPLRWLSLGMRRDTRACNACAPRRDGCGRSKRYRRPLHE